jgi:phospholipid-binding lipoprotein MlaA
MSASFLPLALLLAGAPVDAEAAAPLLPLNLAGLAELDQEALVPASVSASGAIAPVAASPAPAPTAPSVPNEEADLADPSTIVVTARPPAPPGDPFQGVNAITFSTIQTVDKAFTRPVSMAYKRALPGPIRTGLRNFFNNLQEPVVFLNYLLQIKPGKAAETLGRFAVNSTAGAGGLVDVAKKRPFKLPRRPNGFGYTLGYYGVKPGPFLFLPLIGPTTLRDLIGRGIDLLLLPTAVGRPFNRPAYSVVVTTIRSLDERAEADEQITRLRDGSADPYAAVRDAYLKARQAEIDALHGKRHKLVSPVDAGVRK